MTTTMLFIGDPYFQIKIDLSDDFTEEIIVMTSNQSKMNIFPHTSHTPSLSNTGNQTTSFPGLPIELIYLISEYTGDIDSFAKSQIITIDDIKELSNSVHNRRNFELKSIYECLSGHIISSVTKDSPVFIYEKLDEYINQFNLYDDSIVGEDNTFKSNSKFTTDDKDLILKSLIDTVFNLYPEKAFSFLMGRVGLKEIDDDIFSYETDTYSVVVFNKKDTLVQNCVQQNSSQLFVCLGANVTSIEDDAFYGCSSLRSIIIPDSVTNISDGAFYGCSSLTSIIIPDSVTSIGNDAFHRCSSLTSINIPDSVTSIENR